MFVIYENATKNDEPLRKEFLFEPRAEKVWYSGQEFVNVMRVRIQVKKGCKVKATSHPSCIKTIDVTPKGQRK